MWEALQHYLVKNQANLTSKVNRLRITMKTEPKKVPGKVAVRVQFLFKKQCSLKVVQLRDSFLQLLHEIK